MLEFLMSRAIELILINSWSAQRCPWHFFKNWILRKKKIRVFVYSLHIYKYTLHTNIFMSEELHYIDIFRTTDWSVQSCWRDPWRRNSDKQNLWTCRHGDRSWGSWGGRSRTSSQVNLSHSPSNYSWMYCLLLSN